MSDSVKSVPLSDEGVVSTANSNSKANSNSETDINTDTKDTQSSDQVQSTQESNNVPKPDSTGLEAEAEAPPTSKSHATEDSDSFISDITEDDAEDRGASPPELTLKGQKFVLSESSTEVYVTESPGKHQKIVLLLTNSLGLKSINNLKLADIYAERLGCPVIVPDLFNKDPIRTSAAEVDKELGDEPELELNPATSDNNGSIGGFWSSLFTVRGLKSLAVHTVKGFVDEMWLARHTYEKTYLQLSAVISEIVQVYSPKSVGIIGYSFGGRYVMSFLEDQRNNEWSSDEDLVAVGASVHPSLVDQDDFRKVGKPLLIVGAKNDPLLPDTLIRGGVAVLEENNVEHNVVTFSADDGESTSSSKESSGRTRNRSKDTLPHGFAVPGDYTEDVVGDKPSKVINVVCSWILEHL